MALNIKDAETERLAAAVAELAGENKTQAVRNALRERHERLSVQRRTGMSRGERMLWFLENEAWPRLPDTTLGVMMTKVEREEILGYGPDGV